MPLLLFAYTGCCELNYRVGGRPGGVAGRGREEAGAPQSLVPAGQAVLLAQRRGPLHSDLPLAQASLTGTRDCNPMLWRRGLGHTAGRRGKAQSPL